MELSHLTHTQKASTVHLQSHYLKKQKAPLHKTLCCLKLLKRIKFKLILKSYIHKEGKHISTV